MRAYGDLGPALDTYEDPLTDDGGVTGPRGPVPWNLAGRRSVEALFAWLADPGSLR